MQRHVILFQFHLGYLDLSCFISLGLNFFPLQNKQAKSFSKVPSRLCYNNSFLAAPNASQLWKQEENWLALTCTGFSLQHEWKLYRGHCHIDSDMGEESYGQRKLCPRVLGIHSFWEPTELTHTLLLASIEAARITFSKHHPCPPLLIQFSKHGVSTFMFQALLQIQKIH